MILYKRTDSIYYHGEEVRTENENKKNHRIASFTLLGYILQNTVYLFK